MTFDQRPGWCRVCRSDTCDCVYCHSARFVRHASTGQLMRCDACNPAPEPEETLPAPTPIRQRRGRDYADRLDS